MPNDIRDALVRIAIPAAGVAVALFVARLRRISLGTICGSFGPPRTLIVWLVAWAGWIAIEEVVGPALGIGPPERWHYNGRRARARDRHRRARAARRGARLPRAPLPSPARDVLGPYGAIVLTAAFFAAIHTQYGRTSGADLPRWRRVRTCALHVRVAPSHDPHARDRERGRGRAEAVVNAALRSPN